MTSLVENNNNNNNNNNNSVITIKRCRSVHERSTTRVLIGGKTRKNGAEAFGADDWLLGLIVVRNIHSSTQNSIQRRK